MNSFFLYLFQVSAIFGGFYLLYKWLFSQFTFHAVNRSLLLAIVPLSLLLPYSAELFPQLQNFNLELPLINDFTAFSEFEYFAEDTTISTSETVNYALLFLIVYAIGVLGCLARFVITTYSLFKLKRNAKAIIANGETLYIADVSEVFSYFNWIFIPKSETSTFEELIVIHEKAHIQKRHSLDVLLAELFIAFYWFHPLAYSYRKSLKSIHEFQADAFVLHQKVKKSTYLELLLQSLEPKNTNPVYNYFSHPTLKKRIEMITKSQSKNRSKLTYLLLLPVIALVFMAFKNSTGTYIPNEFLPVEIEQTTNSTPSLFPVQNGSIKSISSKYGVTRKHPKLKNTAPHGGIDIKAALGTPVIATADGVILKAKKEDKWGNLIVISHADGFETWYAHLKGFNIDEGIYVTKGDIIGYVGNTGLSTAPHLHYEVRQHGKRLNPIDYIIE
ncbi:M23/M56 family metallopeptidase [uncultured Kordia sp.]|uniref:M23/M56 family metallopeptidase n=1 Tax=uncultured Kordia sp. TaxID=507699 RepID=UPI002620C9B6|nr:M23/M56 family metallopeptidase [uncultured Kordia sp.]